MTLTGCRNCGSRIAPGDRFCPNCGTSQSESQPSAAVPASPWEAILGRLSSATAPRYRILRLLGHGGFAGVYLAEEVRLARRVAIKVMAPGLMVDPKLIERFQQEARTTAQLSHPNIVTVYDVDERDGLHYFIMAYVAGRTLSQVLAAREEPLPTRGVLHWLFQIGSALSHAHRAGVIHRDVKPSNVLLDGDGDALVTDFGIAKVLDEPGLTRTGVAGLGTPAYMSPEQCAAGSVSAASDQYSLAVVAYELLTGRRPFTARTTHALIHAHLTETPAPVGRLRPDLPAQLSDTIDRMLAKRPEERFPGILAALSALEAATLRPDDPLREQLGVLSTTVDTLDVSPVSGQFTPGEFIELAARARDASGRVLAGRLIHWTSEDPGVVTDQGGRLVAVNPGRARLRASCEGVAVAVTVHVTGLDIADLEGEAPSDVAADGEPIVEETSAVGAEPSIGTPEPVFEPGSILVDPAPAPVDPPIAEDPAGASEILRALEAGPNDLLSPPEGAPADPHVEAPPPEISGGLDIETAERGPPKSAGMPAMDGPPRVESAPGTAAPAPPLAPAEPISPRPPGPRRISAATPAGPAFGRDPSPWRRGLAEPKTRIAVGFAVALVAAAAAYALIADPPGPPPPLLPGVLVTNPGRNDAAGQERMSEATIRGAPAGATILADGVPLSGSTVRFDPADPPLLIVIADGFRPDTHQIEMAESSAQLALVFRGVPVGTRRPGPPRVASIALSPDVSELEVGTRGTIRGRAMDDRGGELASASIGWESLDPSIAAIVQRLDRRVVIEGRGPGTARIRASSDGAAQTVSIRVRAAPLPEPESTEIPPPSRPMAEVASPVARVGLDPDGRRLLVSASFRVTAVPAGRWCAAATLAPDRGNRVMTAGQNFDAADGNIVSLDFAAGFDALGFPPVGNEARRVSAQVTIWSTACPPPGGGRQPVETVDVPAVCLERYLARDWRIADCR